MRDPLLTPSPLRIFTRMLLGTSPFGGMLFPNETLYTTILGQMR